MASGVPAQDRAIVLIAALIAAALVALVVCGWAVSTAAYTKDQAAITACVSNGGSWIVDGHIGECWQRDMLGEGAPDGDS